MPPYTGGQFGIVSGTVLDALHFKHPDPSVPPASILPLLDNLPYLEDVEITSAPIQSVAANYRWVLVLEDVMHLTGEIYFVEIQCF